MNQWFHLRCPSHHFLSLPSRLSLLFQFPGPKLCAPISATHEPARNQQLTAREQRQLKNLRRQSKGATNWREEVEERLLKKPKKQFASWKEELNLDQLALLGPQWWVVRVSRVSGQYTAERLARSLAKNYPDIEFKVYFPAVQVKRKLKNGSYSVKPKPQFPGCVFLRCVLNKEIHDFIREYDGVGGFVGSKVGNTKRQINKPRPVSVEDMEAVFQKAREEQEKSDQTFREEYGQDTLNSENQNLNALLDSEVVVESKPKRQSRKASEVLSSNSSSGSDDKLLISGATVRVVSGTFAEFVGSLKKLDLKTRKATVQITMFGKETFVDLNVNEIVAETN